MTGVEGIPTDEVSAVVIDLTGTAAAGPGFITAWPTGQTRPLASNVLLGTGGEVSLFAPNGAHLLADVAGYYIQ